MSLRTILILSAVLAASAAAQEGSLNGPVSGLVFDQHARAVRPMMGVPGGAYLGVAVASGVELAAVSPNGRAMVVSRQGKLLLGRHTADGFDWSALAEDLPVPDQIRWNRASTAVAVVASGRPLLWRTTGETAGAISLAAIPEGPITALAVEDSAGALVVAIAGDTDGGIYRADAEAARLLARLANPGPLALDGRGGLFFVDRDRQEVLVISEYSRASDIQLLAGSAHGLADLVGLALASGGRSLLIADRKTRRLIQWDLAEFAVSRTIDVGFEPARLEPFGDGKLFLLSHRSQSSDTLYVLDHGAEPAVYFVPAGDAEPGQPVVED